MTDQMEFWNSTPEPWRKRMERDAFAIAFPGEGYLEEDDVTVFMNYSKPQPRFEYSEWTYEPTIHGGFVIEVRWAGERPRKLKPHQSSRPPLPFSKVKRYENDEAKKFWLKLMRKGAK